VKLLLDANLSWRLCKSLLKTGIESLHVDLEKAWKQPAKDIEIWNYALKYDFIILTNDEDFIDLAALKGHPPKIIILKTGNQSSKYMESLLISYMPRIEEFAKQNEYGTLEVF
jgi:predicted nuclease of predicted toxin-antitoxin system